MCGGVRIFGEASGPVEPSEGAFPDPGLGQDLARLSFSLTTLMVQPNISLAQSIGFSV